MKPAYDEAEAEARWCEAEPEDEAKNIFRGPGRGQ